MAQQIKTADYGLTVNGSVLSSYGTIGYNLSDCSISFGTADDTVSIKVNELAEAVDKLTKTPEVAPETTTKLDIKGNDIFVKHYKDGFFKSDRRIMPDIKNVRVHGKTVMVDFADNTYTVAVLHDEDAFNLEQGISICITKKLLGQDGGSVYNKLIRRALKVMDQNAKAEREAAAKKEYIKSKKQAAVNKRNKQKAKKREEQIEIQKEAFVRALDAVVGNKKLFSKNFLKNLLTND